MIAMYKNIFVANMHIKEIKKQVKGMETI